MIRILLLSLFSMAAFICQAQTGMQVSANEPESDFPVFDPSCETVTFGGQTFILRDSRLHIHFVSFLASQKDKTIAAMEYYRDLANIKKVLAPGSTYSNKIRLAYGTLKNAARYLGDHNVSESLGSAVVSAINALDTIRQRDANDQSLKEEYAALLRKMKFAETRTDLSNNEKLDRKKNAKRQIEKNKSSSKYQDLIRKRNLVLRRIKENSVQGKGIVKKAQIEFQSTLIQLFLQRRFEHVVIGCRFYMELFKPEDSSIDLDKNSVVAGFFKDSLGVEPSIIGLEAFANEIIGKVSSLFDQAVNHANNKQLHSGSNRLFEAYAIGEHLTFIQTLPFKQKEKFYEYNFTSNKLLDSIQAKNFALAEELNNTLKTMAVDYRYSRVEAFIQGYVKASNSHALKAFTHLSDGDQRKMFQEIENAKALWPLNPKIEEFNQLIKKGLQDARESGDNYSALCKKFDSLVSNQHYLKILKAENRKMFATQFYYHKDNARIDKLKEISNRYEPLVTGLKACALLAERKQNILAWEKCSSLYQKFPNYNEIAPQLMKYKERAFRYRNLLKEAANLKQQGHRGSALSCYLKALEYEPKASLAKQGVEDLMRRASK